MKRLVLASTAILVMVATAAVGCAVEESVMIPGEGAAVVSSCVGCHSDKDILKEVATPEPEEEGSGATSGEG